ncbi:CotD family spore coat protein [Fictibacillus sp. b24]|uniref:CotD family spore coat protein n=1 Tax=unclassified Fictibacillus TaxID=2644029 RepID=UPI0025A29C84|nr:CotD family spore coat protein [Fictibacillus sp. b24]MDM5316725.1 CotD family spore coat protein [Fictibacillus sp. b24]
MGLFKRPGIFAKKGMGMPAAGAMGMGPMGPTMGAMGMGPTMGAMGQMGGPVMGAMSQMPQMGALPSQYYPPQVLPAQYSPTNQQVQYNQQDVYVPMIHPTQTTQVNQMNYKYVHYFPQNTNVLNQATQQNIMGTTQPMLPPCPCPPPCPPPCGPWRKK